MIAISDAICRYIDFLSHAKNYSHNTILSYSNDLNQLSDYLLSEFEIVDLCKLNSSILRSHIASLAKNEVGPKSLNRKISAIKSFFTYLYNNDFLETNPSLKLQSVKLPKRLPTIINESNLLNYFGDLITDKSNFEANRDYCILKLFYLTGIRRSELINIELPDLDLKKGEIRVLGKGNKERIIPISEEFIAELRSYIILRNNKEEINCNFLFISEKGEKLYPKLIYNIVTKNLGKITTAKKRSPHVLRHSFATHSLDQGADLIAIKEILGHSSLAATQVYTHNSIEKLKRVYKKSHPKAN
jgi:integrase/recombinase XerC